MTEININEKIEQLAKIFNIGGDIVSIDMIKNGNINNTYDVVMNCDGEEKRYIFQKVNIYVFKNPKRIMMNIDLITSHISQKLKERELGSDRVMHFANTDDGKNYYMDEQSFWRVCEFVPNSMAISECEDLSVLEHAGKAFGDFQMMLADFDASQLFETIPNFHNTRSRIAVFFRHVNEDPCGRVEDVQPEIEKVEKFRKLACRLNELIDSQELPIRVTHNDTKINNVLFDRDTKEAKTVIDLDTVMPGLVAYDFGDAVRFAASTAAEDEKDLSKVALDMDKFRAFASGFIGEVANAITPIEIKTLPMGAFTMAVELAVRFLDDYITGDRYFKTDYRGHNLVRARCQLKLAEDMFEHLADMNDIVSEISGIKY